MKVLFWDVDGVLNYKDCDAYYGGVYFVVDEKVRLLERIISTTGAKLVLTSTWRYGYYDLLKGNDSFEAELYVALTEILEERGLYIYDCTGVREATRGEEIAAWIKNTDEIVEAFVILDDMGAEQFGQYAEYLVQVDERVGLEERQVELAIQMLEN